jgi:hypothetical protein
MPESDKFFLGNDLCVTARQNNHNEPTQPPFSMTFPSGDSYRFCKRTVREDTLHWLTENRMAVNHVELATNESAMNVQGHERIIFNEFSDRFNPGDFAMEWNFTRSRFHEACSYSPKISTPIKVKVAEQFWYGDKYRAYILSCITPLVGVQMGGVPLPQTRDWQIGAIFLVKEELPWGCFGRAFAPSHCGNYSNTSVLEVTYMSDRIQSDYNFARTMQIKLLKEAGLRAVMP